MAEQAYAYVTLIPVAKGFKNSIQKELSGVDGIGGAIGAQAGGKFSAGFGGALKSLAITAGSALAAVGVGRFFSDSIKQASDLGESINAVNKAYGEFSGDVLKLGGDVANRLGLSTVDFNAAAVRFSAFANRIAGEGGNVAGVVDSLTTRAADFASVYNIEVSEALQVFQSGLSGEAEPLKRFGINLLDSEVKAYAYANGIASVGKELTETEKVQARYGLLLQSTAMTAGDFADTSDGLANSQRILAANVENLKAQVGAGLTPVMATFTSALVPLANIIFPALANFLNTYIAPGLQKAADAFKAFADSAGEGGGIFDTLLAKMGEFFTGDGLTNFFDQIAGLRTRFFEAIQRALPGIIDSMVAFVPVFLETAVKFFSLLIDALLQIIPPLVETLLQALPKLIDALLSLLPVFIDAAVKLFTALIDSIDIILPPLIDAIIALIPAIVNALVSALPKLVDGAIKLFTALLTALEKFIPDLIKAVLKLVPIIVDTLLRNLPLLIDAGIQLLAGLAKGIIENAPRILAAAVGAIGEVLVDGVKDFLGIRSPSLVFEQIGENVGQGLINGMEAMSDGVAYTAEQLALLSTAPMDKALKKLEKDAAKYSGYNPETSGMAVRADGSFDVGQITSDLNSIYAYMGIKTAKEMIGVQKTIFGGTFQQALNKINPNPQATLYNTKTGRSVTIGAADQESLQLAIERAMAEGFTTKLPELTTSIDELKDNIGSLSKQIKEKGLVPAGVAMANGGYVDGPTPALIGEAGPEVVIPLDRFETMMGLKDSKGKTLNYFAAPNQSLDSEQELLMAMRRARVVGQW